MLKKQRVLISGDSFAAYDSNNSKYQSSWTSLLTQQYEVVNVAQAGVGEYKILKQLQDHDLEQFDCIVVVHTSPNRVHISRHPVHANSQLHKHCDLIYTDVENNLANDIILVTAQNYFKYIFDETYYHDIHSLLCKEIFYLTETKLTLHLTFFPHLHNKIIDLSKIWKRHPGAINHLDTVGNYQVRDYVIKWINQHY